MTLRQKFTQYLAPTSDAPVGITIQRADGVYLYDTEDKPYFDFISGIAVSNVGHNNPEVVRAIQKQAGEYLHLMVYGEYVQQPQVLFAQKLVQQLPEQLNSVFFVNSGSEAVEGAMKLAKRVTKKHEFVCFKGAYHGGTQGALSIISDESYKTNFRPLLPGIHQGTYNDLNSVELITKNTAAVIVEPIQGESGYTVARQAFLEAIRAKCDETCTLLIFDEIQSGMGRTGKLFAFEHFGVEPDILLSAKALGAGMPIGAFIANQKLMQTLTADPVLGHITTFGGHPVSCASGLAALNYLLENDVLTSIEAKHACIKRHFGHHPAIKSFSGVGLMCAIAFEDSGTNFAIIEECKTLGLLTDWFLFNDYTLRIAPPLTITLQELETACNIILKAIEKVCKN